MKLCFTSHVSFTKDGESNYYCTPGFAKLLEMIGPLCEQVELCVPVFDFSPPKGDAAVSVANLKICALPAYYNRGEIAALRHPVMLMRSLWPIIKRADAVLINLPNYLSVWAWVVCLLQRKRFAIRVAGNWPEVMKLAFYNHKMYILGNVAAILHKIMLAPMIRTSTVTFAHGKELADIYGPKYKNIVMVISSTIHNSDIADSVASSRGSNCKILYVGRVQFLKGLDNLFEAAAELRKEGLNFRITIAGDGSQMNYYETIVKQLNLCDIVDFIGWIPLEKLKSVYSKSDIFVFPSYSETGPKVVIEAMANGLPVIVTRVGSAPVVVKDGVTGFIVPIKNTEELKKAMVKLILNKDTRRQMGKAGLERARLFTMEAERQCIKEAFLKSGLLEINN